MVRVLECDANLCCMGNLAPGVGKKSVLAKSVHFFCTYLMTAATAIWRQRGWESIRCQFRKKSYWGVWHHVPQGFPWSFVGGKCDLWRDEIVRLLKNKVFDWRWSRVQFDRYRPSLVLALNSVINCLHYLCVTRLSKATIFVFNMLLLQLSKLSHTH